MYPHPPTESSKVPAEAAVFFGADNTVPKSETTITSEGDHITSINDCMLDSDFSTTTSNKIASTKERQKPEDEVEAHIKSSAPPEREVTTPTGTMNTTAKEYHSETFIPVNVSKGSSPVATVSLIDFSTITKEDILLAAVDVEDEEPMQLAEGSDGLAESTDSPAPAAKKEADTDKATDSFFPEAEVFPSTEGNFSSIPDITDLTEESITEVNLVVCQKDPKTVVSLNDTDEEKFITVFELTASAEKHKGNLEETLSDEEATDEVGVWMQRHRIKGADTNPILLTAAESRYDFRVPASAAVNITGDSATDTMEDLPENNTTESVPEDTETLSDPANYEEDTSAAETGIFKLLKEDPDEFMM